MCITFNREDLFMEIKMKRIVSFILIVLLIIPTLTMPLAAIKTYGLNIFDGADEKHQHSLTYTDETG